MDDKMGAMAARLGEIAAELQGMCAEMGGGEESVEDDGSGELEGGEPKMPGKAPAAIILALKKGMKEE